MKKEILVLRKKVVELKSLEQRQTYKRPNLEGKLGEGFIVFPKTDYSLFKNVVEASVGVDEILVPLLDNFSKIEVVC